MGAAITRFDEDDEYSVAFLNVVILTVRGHSGGRVSLGEDLQRALEKRGCNLCYIWLADDTITLPEGPYFFDNGSIFRMWRLYEDIMAPFNLRLSQEPSITRNWDAIPPSRVPLG